ncbi:MAG TPA: sigma-70 family RNA polymerase sigma factor [Polyangia bacterium]|nr:sigma-70 family RNA polymerase sigma factor [Polyangia bacterium]
MREKAASLYRTYGPVIFARCRRMLSDDAEAEDATQEVFLRVARHLDEAVGPDEAILWIHRVATNYCLNEIRNRKRRRRHQSPSQEDVDRAADLTGDNEEVVANRDLARRIAERSPERLTRLAKLHYLDGLSHEEVGKTLGVSRRTVINHLAEFRRRALRMLGRMS